MRASVWHGLALVAGLGLAVSVGASCSGRPLVGSPNANWRPVGCPQAGDPPIYLAEADGDFYRLDPNTFGATRLGAITCPQGGSVNYMAVNRRGEVVLALGEMRVGRVRIQGGANPLSACESTGFPSGPTTPITKYSGFAFVLTNENDIAGDDVYLWATDNSEQATFLARYSSVGVAPIATPQIRFSDGDRSDELCRPPTQGMMVPPTCSGPRVAVELASYPNRNATNRSLVAATFANGAFQILFIDNPEDARITEIKTVQGVPIDAYSRFQTATVWGDSLYLFVGRSTPMSMGDGGPPVVVPPPTFTTVHRVPLDTAMADPNVGQLDGIIPNAASVPPCMRYAPGN
jgi:hypothetical protein